jgi:regulator of protease activity HflC (stomatin/prohibitin superfamily)
VVLLQFGFIGAPRPPEQVINSINLAQQAKYLALQKENELAQSKAEAAKSVAYATGEANAAIARAEGQAKANKLLSDSLTDRVLERIRLDVQWKWIDKWNGQTPSTMIGGDKSNLLLNVPTNRPN